ncbi:Coenzyme F420 hydrogenase/dehydrogenase, beta subunit C-terminal domain [bacterium]|nr:Coenzyme F420 hydrogenase/dehydrogenase, beta subunit C-terminal domain [bacterium]
MKGTTLPVEKDLNQTLIDFLKKGLESGGFDAVLLPSRVPSGDSFAYLLIKNPSLLEEATPLPPVMPVQGAKAVSSLTQYGKTNQKILAAMRPCEIRAATELSKLKQAELENILFLSLDCPGALPLSDYLENPREKDKVFQEALENRKTESMRPVCQVCREFSTTTGDLHVGRWGAEKGRVFLISSSEQGKKIQETMGNQGDQSVDSWESKVKELKEQRLQERAQFHEDLKTKAGGPDKLLEFFNQCINCHNCMRACPVCYCRQCYFDSEAFDLPVDDFLKRAKKKGSLRLPTDTLLFQLGRMSHMVHSCVSCGTCEDACPMDIPVAQLFSLVADQTQKLFQYSPGRNREEPLPFSVYKEEEFHEVETPYRKTYSKGEGKNA